MVDTVEFYRVAIFFLFFVVKGTYAGFDFGDTLALLIGLFIGFVALFACLGCYARKRGTR